MAEQMRRARASMAAMVLRTRQGTTVLTPTCLQIVRKIDNVSVFCTVLKSRELCIAEYIVLSLGQCMLFKLLKCMKTCALLKSPETTTCS
jgi:hypothetical protein